MGAGRTGLLRDDVSLLREYSALFGDKTVQKVMRYIAVRDELVRRHGKNKIGGMAAEQRRLDAAK